MLTPLFLAHCSFDKTPTPAIIGFELFIVTGTAIAFWLLNRIQTKVWLRFLILAGAVLLFELFTAPMWKNEKLGVWAYLYLDVSWVLTIGWTSLILTVVTVCDRLLEQWKEWQRFPAYLGVLTVAVTGLEMLVVNLGIRSYAPEVLADMSPVFVLGVPIVDVFYYTPVFMGLVISFYKYWMFIVEDEPLIPSKQRKWLRSIFIAFLAVFLFEVMIQPMVENRGFPQWSYIFFDISVILTGAWVLIIGIAAVVIDRLFLHFPVVYRFLLAMGITGAIAWPTEAWLMANNYRVYGESATHNFTGHITPLLNTPVEIAFAIPCYMALVIAFIRYWETILDNRL
ncbi:MAG: hypothetical protein F6J87_07030 [Spirulina sp. SIO3F2]|nr:hypothetical protein [Spirulina sp. SIO3F2]